MDEFSSLISLTGRWRGNYRLFVEPGNPARESQITAVVAPVAGGRFARIDYTWGDRDKPNDGWILFVTALWVDSSAAARQLRKAVVSASPHKLVPFVAPPTYVRTAPVT